jgi:hypothetical protein
MDDGDYTALVTPIGDHDVEPEAGAPPITIQLTVEGIDRTDWTASINGSQPSPVSGAGRVQVQLSDEAGQDYAAPADFDPKRSPHFTGVGPFQGID